MASFSASSQSNTFTEIEGEKISDFHSRLSSFESKSKQQTQPPKITRRISRQNFSFQKDDRQKEPSPQGSILAGRKSPSIREIRDSSGQPVNDDDDDRLAKEAARIERRISAFSGTIPRSISRSKFPEVSKPIVPTSRPDPQNHRPGLVKKHPETSSDELKVSKYSVQAISSRKVESTSSSMSEIEGGIPVNTAPALPPRPQPVVRKSITVSRATSRKPNLSNLPCMYWNEVREVLTPLDLIFTRGTTLGSHGVAILSQIGSGSNYYTHVGIVVTKELLPSFDQLEDGKIYILESIMNSERALIPQTAIPDLYQGQIVSGVQIRDLDLLFEEYVKEKQATRMGWAQVYNNPWLEHNNRERIIRIFQRAFNAYIGAPYENRIANIFTLMGFFRKSKPVIMPDYQLGDKLQGADTHTFCSELVTRIFQMLGMIRRDIDAERVLPMDFLGWDRDGDIDKYFISQLTEVHLTLQPAPEAPVPFVPQLYRRRSVREITEDYESLIEKLKAYRSSLEVHPDRTPKTRALIIGINYRQSHGLRLDGCISDAQRMKKFILAMGYDPEYVLYMTDSDGTPQRLIPTYHNVSDAMKWLLTGATVKDFLLQSPNRWPSASTNVETRYFMHYSGHGVQVQDYDGDERDGQDEAIALLNDNQTWYSAMTDDYIRSELVDRIPSNGNLFVVMDCCHSGTIMDLPYTYDGMEIRSNRNFCGTNITCISGCTDAQVSADFTFKGVKTGATTAAFFDVYLKNPNVNLGDLARGMNEFRKKNIWNNQTICVSTNGKMDLNMKVYI